MVVASPDLKPDDFIVFQMPGLSATTDAHGYLWVCMCQSRGGNDAFYIWFIQNVVLPFIILCRSNSGVESPLVLYSTDGEEIQLRNFIAESSAFLLLQVALMKHSASCSALTNALDTGNIHKATKKSAKHTPTTFCASPPSIAKKHKVEV